MAKLYRGFPNRLHHTVPSWVENGALFHIRIRQDRSATQLALTDSTLAPQLLESASFYEENRRWHIGIFLLMPDHLHALLCFPSDEAMSEVIRAWKRFQTRQRNVHWQENYFDHRLREDEAGAQLSAKVNYIRNNPVAAGLCASADYWKWKIDRYT